MRGRDKVRSISPGVASSHRNFAKVACLETGAALVFVIILVLVFRQAKKRIILWPQPLSHLCICVDPKKFLSAPFDSYIGVVISVQPIAFMIENVAMEQ